MGSISCHITPLVINSLGGGHTHKHTNTHTDIRTGTISKNQARAGLWPAHAWFNDLSNLNYLASYVPHHRNNYYKQVDIISDAVNIVPSMTCI